MIDLKAALAKAEAEQKRWYAGYASAVARVRRATRADFVDPAFQRWLWSETNRAIGIGSGNRVTLSPTAYDDDKLSEALWSVLRMSGGGRAFVRRLDERFDEILRAAREYADLNYRPRARLMRAFALLRPWDVTTIVGDAGLDATLSAMGQASAGLSLMEKHARIQATIWAELGRPSDDELPTQLWLNILAYEIPHLARAEDGIAQMASTPDAEAPVGDEDIGETTPPDDGDVREPEAAATDDQLRADWLAPSAGELPPLPFDAIRDAFTALAGDRFVFDTALLLRTLHAALTALPDKRFVVIGGLSGTGKTSFARFYSAAVCAALGLDDPDAHRRFIAVRPDWTDPSGLLGHANLLVDPPKWHRTPTLSLLMTARAHPAKPYFLILEEMNLALVEHYLAPLLAAMENPESGLAIHGEPRAIQGVPPLMPWPRNLFIIGTVNMDATTHAFSDKVLDRAFIWEFDAIRIDTWRDQKRAAEPPSPHIEVVSDLLTRLYKPLEKARRHFGYRVCDEVLAFCDAAGEANSDVLDTAVFSKVLPRLRGDDLGGLADALKEVEAVCRTHKLSRSADRVERMHDTLKATGTARFWS